MHKPANGFLDAAIDVTVTAFFEADPEDPDKLCRAGFKLRNTSSAVQQNDETFNVKEKARLVFFFHGGYEPADLKFHEVTSNGDQHGYRNLVDRRTSGNTAEAKDILKPGFKGARWKILIPIRSPDGRIGVVDPEICNQDEDSSSL